MSRVLGTTRQRCACTYRSEPAPAIEVANTVRGKDGIVFDARGVGCGIASRRVDGYDFLAVYTASS